MARPVTADVRIGIVSWNTAGLLDKALEALPGAVGGLTTELVVVDNASSDESVEVARSHRDVRVVVNDSNVGYALAINEALAGTDARALIALNPDTVPPPGSLEELVRTLDAHPRAAIVAPVLIGSDGLPQRSVFPYPGLRSSLETAIVPHRFRRDMVPKHGTGVRTLHGRWVIGAVHCLRRAALGSRPPYSARWFMYVEDLELCWRLQKAGWSGLLREDVCVVHHGNAAGIQQWGEGTDLELRSLPNIYEWIWSDRSPLQGRASALVNAVGAEAKRWALELRALRSGNPKRRELPPAMEFHRLAKFHARVFLEGPSVQPVDAASSSS